MQVGEEEVVYEAMDEEWRGIITKPWEMVR